ncbi:MAG: ferredoxin [Phycisphaerae bacterium]|nr:ferredoxin [Phycisphaerae bacterium]
MKAIVNADTCTGCGICVDICPEVFQFVGNVAQAILDPVPNLLEEATSQAADSCPVEAIKIS